MRFELHCHSTCSDGTERPEQVAARAAARGVEVFALTDHDTCAGSSVTVPGARVIRAVEISCDEPSTGRTIHVLAYDRGGVGWSELERKLADLREARRNRMRVMGARLAQRGIRIDVEPLIAEAETSGRTLGRPDLARLMIEHGAVTSLKEAFTRHLYDGGPVDVPHHALTLVDALALGRSAFAAMSLAHPHLYDQLGASVSAGSTSRRTSSWSRRVARTGTAPRRRTRRWASISMPSIRPASKSGCSPTSVSVARATAGGTR
jgi:predicted metal-dependent phosphoesterase TrpH